MSPPEPALLPREPKSGSTVFAEPWHAEALGIANALIQSGMYTHVEWAEALGAEILRHTSAEPETDETYYQAVLAALEKLVGAKSPETGGSLGDRVEAWRRAYLNTPHGRPVTLAGTGGPAVDYEPDNPGGHHHTHY